MQSMRKQRSKGFTLLETIVTIVVLSIMAFSVMYIMMEGLRIWWENRNLVELRSDGRYALSRLKAEFRQAEDVTFLLAEPDKIIFDSDIDNDGVVQEITYEKSGTDLTRKEGAGSAYVICGNLSSLTFSWNSPVLTVADMTLSKQGDTVKLQTEMVARCLP